jgi:hypothetical protein
MANNPAPVLFFLALFLAASGCVVAGTFLMWGLAAALFSAAPFFLALALIVATGIARNG